ncbi:MAG: DUF2909 domain-containing protein [Pseudomonadales bacterium]
MAHPIVVATPLIKIVIVILLVGVLASLASGLVFLFKDSDLPGSKRTLHSLGVRITLAAALLATIFYGFMTGELKMGQSAPWHDRATDPVDVVD